MLERLDIAELVALTQVNRKLARASHPPFTDWTAVYRVLRAELDEFQKHAEAGHYAQCVNELAGIAATAQLAAVEVPLND